MVGVYDLWKDAHRGHNLDRNRRIYSAVQCLMLIRDLVSFEHVVDFGCGIGAWIHAAQLLGAGSVLGIEGEWIKENDILIEKSNIKIVDLSKEILDLKKSFTLAITVEVAEHLPPDAADGFCQTIVNASDYILFSAAKPGQGGIGHFNEQPLLYWVGKFWARGYVPIEPIRPFIADNMEILPWLRENLIMFVKYDKMLRSPNLLRFARPISDFGLIYRK